MNRITTLSLALIAATTVLGAGCNRQDDPMTSGAPGAGPGTSTTTPGGMNSDSGMPATPPASAASR